MAYVGRSPRYGFLEGQTATFNGSTTVVTLQRNVSSTDAIDVYIDNVHQEPDVAYTLSSGGNSITFTGTPDNGAVLYIRFHGLAFDTARAYRLVNSDEGSSLTLGNDDTLTLSLDGTTALTATSSGITIPNLTVTGTTTSVNSTNLNIGDNTILLNSDVANDAAPTESAGITINRGSSADVDFIWNETTDEWYAANDLATGGIFRVKGTGSDPTYGSHNLGIFRNSGTGDAAKISIIGNSGTYSRINFGDENDDDVGQLNYSHTADAFSLNKGLGVTGNITVSGTVDGADIAALNTNALLKTGGTMTGALTINQPGNTPQLRISGNANWDFYSYNDTNFYVNNASGTVLGLHGNRNAYFSKNLSVGDSVLSTYHANYPAIDIGSSASVQGFTGNNGVWLQSNLFMNTNGHWTSKSDDYSAMIELYDGNINFYNTASGTGTRALLTPMTIRQSGNVLIGKTTEGLGTTGNQFGSDGYVYHTRAGDVMWINRTASSSGTLLTFMDNSATVGRIQSRSTDYLNVQIGSLGTGITGTSEHTILPSVNNARSNNTNDLGNSVYRWKDLFLAGDINMRTTTAGAISGGNNRTGSVIKLHHEAQWESGYGNNKAASTNDYLGGIEFSTGDGSTGEGVRAAIRATVDSYYNQNSIVFETADHGDTTLDERLRITDTGRIGINSPDPNFLVHINKGTSSYAPARTTETVLGVNSSYDAAGTLGFNITQMDGNWLDGTSGGDTAFGPIWTHQDNVRAGILYDVRNTEKFQLFSSYGPIEFMTNATSSGNAVPTDSSMTTKMKIALNGNVGIGIDPQVLLHVQAGTTGNGTVRIGGGAGLQLSHNNSGATVQTIESLYRTTNASANLQIKTGHLTIFTGTGGAEAVKIDTTQTIWNGGNQSYSDNYRVYAHTENVSSLFNNTTNGQAQTITVGNTLPYQHVVPVVVAFSYNGNGAISYTKTLLVENGFNNIMIEVLGTNDSDGGPIMNSVSFNATGSYNNRKLQITGNPGSNYSMSNWNCSVYYGAAWN